MNIVFIHIGKEVPSYFWNTIEQARLVTRIGIHVVIPKNSIDSKKVAQYNVVAVPYESLLDDPLNREFEKVNCLTGFWEVTLQRLLLLEIYMRRTNMNETVHLENDVLIYDSPGNYRDELQSAGAGRVLLTPIGEKYISAAFLHTNGHVALSRLNERLLWYLKMGMDKLVKRFGDVNEMRFLSDVLKTTSHIATLPVLPEGGDNCKIKRFFPKGILFDGASWGQYVGGTKCDPPGWAGDHHYVGRRLKRGHYKVIWIEHHGKKFPYVMNPLGKMWKLLNLHIHSKNIVKWMS